MPKVYKFSIDMTCGGCSGAVKRILTKDDRFPADAIVCEWETKELAVTTDREDEIQDEIIEALSKWATANNKTVEFTGCEDA